MSLATLLNRPCTIIHRTDSGEEDDYGDAIPTETYVETTCEIQQVRSDEPALEGEHSVTDWNLYLPVDVLIDTGDAVLVGEVEYEVVGDPWHADSGSPQVHHTEVRVRKTGTQEVGS